MIVCYKTLSFHFIGVLVQFVTDGRYGRIRGHQRRRKQENPSHLSTSTSECAHTGKKLWFVQSSTLS